MNEGIEIVMSMKSSPIKVRVFHKILNGYVKGYIVNAGKSTYFLLTNEKRIDGNRSEKFKPIMDRLGMEYSWEFNIKGGRFTDQVEKVYLIEDKITLPNNENVSIEDVGDTLFFRDENNVIVFSVYKKDLYGLV